MIRIGGEIGYRVLRRLRPPGDLAGFVAPKFSYVPKLRRAMGDDAWSALRGKTVIDFGCGDGCGAIELARHGARVIGIDIRPSVLEEARLAAERAGVAGRCRFVVEGDEPADVIVSVDAFEHFDDPAGVLATMHRLLRDDGRVVLSFGPTWYHPNGGHLFSIFPWSHLVFTEEAQLRWRADFKHDGATRFAEIAGGLNQMTVRRFVALVERSPFRFERFRAVPIRPLRWLHSPLTREFTTSVVECTLVKGGPHVRIRS